MYNNDMQGTKITPTGCVNGDSIPITSEKCDNRVDIPKELPRVGGISYILSALVFVCLVYFVIKGIYEYRKN